MRILVTGGGGFVGLHLLREVLKHDVDELIATVPGDPAVQVPNIGGVEWFPLDVTSLESVRNVVGRVQPDVVYHLAGQASVGASFEAPLVTWDVNATGTLRLIEALRELSPGTQRLVLASSAEVYGVVSPDEQPIVEGSPFGPVNPYGASKAAAELAALGASRQGGLQVVITRMFNLIGPGQDERFVLPSIARQLTASDFVEGKRRALKLGNLAVERDFLDVRDAVSAYLTLMERGRAGDAYNICSGIARPLSAVVARLVELSGLDVDITVDQSRVRPSDIPVLAGENTKLRDLGWAPQFSLDSTLLAILADARESP